MPNTTYVLTKERQARSQLSLLLRDLGYRPEFHECVETLLATLTERQLSSTCFIDSEIDLGAAAIKSLTEIRPRNKLIGFECFQTDRESKAHRVPEIFATMIILPNHAERAKSRLKNALRQTGSSQITKRTTTRPPFPRKSSSGLTKLPFGRSKSLSSLATSITNNPRYLVSDSTAARTLLYDLKKLSHEQSNLLLLGEDEAEFELVARELNYCVNHDATAIEVVSGDDISIDFLEKMERRANADKKPTIAYVGRVDDWSERAIRELSLFIEYLSNLRTPHLRIVIAHQKGSDEFFQMGVADHFPKLRKQTQTIHIPSLAERPEDIPAICQSLIASMRAAHPFLIVGRVSSEAITYITEDRANYSYAKLVRILRNSIALCQRSTLQLEDFKNYGESDMTTQHLLESMADEEYFPAAQSANF